MLHTERLNESKGMLKIDLMEKYLENLGQGTNPLKHLRNRDCILRLNTTH